MKASVVIFVGFFAFVYPVSQELKEKFMAHMEQVGEKCTAETGASADDIAKLINHIPPTTHEGKCMIFCAHKEYKVQKEDGSYDRENFLVTMEPLKNDDIDMYNKVIEISSSCESTPVDSDPCEYAVALATCAMIKSKEMGIDSHMLNER